MTQLTEILLIIAMIGITLIPISDIFIHYRKNNRNDNTRNNK